MKQLLKITRKVSVWILLISFLGCSDNDLADLPQVESSFTYTVNEDTGTVTFINVSKEAKTFLWDFGDGTTSKEKDPVKTYTSSGTYKVTLVASNQAGASNTYESEITISIKKVASLPITFDEEDVIYDVVVFGGTAFQIVENPDPSGSNDKAGNVGELTNSGEESEGCFIDLGSPLDLADEKTVTMNFWSDVAVDVLLKLEEGSAEFIQTTAKHSGEGWEKISFDFNSSASYNRLTLFVDAEGQTAGTFYFDDIEQAEGDNGGGECEPETSQSLDAADFDLTFQTDPGDFIGSFGGNFSYIDNPDFDNMVNPSCKVGQIDRDGQEFANTQFTFDAKLDFNANSGFKLKVWSPAAGTNVLVKLEDKNDPNINVEVPAVTTVANAWEELTFDFAPGESGKYDKIILFFELGQAGLVETYYIDDFRLYGDGGGGAPECIAETSQSLDAADFDLTFQTDPGDFIGSFGGNFSYIDNPDFDNMVNPSCKVGQIDRDGQEFANTQFTFDAKLDFNANSGFKLKVWSPAAGTNVLVKLEDKNDPNINVEVPAVTTVANAWEELTFDFAPGESGKYDKIILFFELGQAGLVETYYIDDFRLYGDGGGGGELAKFPLDFEDGVLFFNAFEGATAAIIDNPDATGNPSSKVLELVKPAGVPFYAGMNSDQKLGGPSIDLANGLIFKVKVWSPKAGIRVRMRLEQEPGVIDPPAYEIFQTLDTANEWVTLTFDFSSTPALADYVYTRLVLNTDWDTDPAGGETYYIDDITQE